MVLHNLFVSFTNDSNKEVHEANKKDNNVDGVEDYPDTHNHEIRINLVANLSLVDPECVLRNCDISN